MVPLFAHHDGGLMRSLDFFHLAPRTTPEHLIAFGAYGLALGVVVAATVGLGLLARRACAVLPRRGRDRAGLRVLEG